MASAGWHYRYVATLIERLAQVAYEAHRAALPTSVPPWEDITKQEQQAWKAAVSAVAGQAGGTIPELPPTASPWSSRSETSVIPSVPTSPSAVRAASSSTTTSLLASTPVS